MGSTGCKLGKKIVMVSRQSGMVTEEKTEIRPNGNHGTAGYQAGRLGLFI